MPTNTVRMADILSIGAIVVPCGDTSCTTTMCLHTGVVTVYRDEEYGPDDDGYGCAITLSPLLSGVRKDWLKLPIAELRSLLYLLGHEMAMDPKSFGELVDIVND